MNSGHKSKPSQSDDLRYWSTPPPRKNWAYPSQLSFVPRGLLTLAYFWFCLTANFPYTYRVSDLVPNTNRPHLQNLRELQEHDYTVLHTAIFKTNSYVHVRTTSLLCVCPNRMELAQT